MSTHRASRPPDDRAEKSAASGRRRAVGVGQDDAGGGVGWRRRPSRSTVAGAGALLLVVAAGATSGHLLASAGTSDATAPKIRPAAIQRDARPADSAPAQRSITAHAARRVDAVSRSAARPRLATPVAPRLQAQQRVTVTRQAERQAEARTQRLASTAEAARSYAKELTSDEWVLPTTGFHISVWFGEAGSYWSSGYHTGIDFATAYGTPVTAVADATVAQTGWDGAYGNQIRLQFENGDQVWYNHLSAIEVNAGQHVQKGQTLGRVGETGNAFGAHLHFEYRLAKDLHTGVDPLPFLNEHGINLR